MIRFCKRTLALVLWAGAVVPAMAATYFIDAASGSDAWSGTAPTAGATDGPWRSLAKLAGNTLLPGDTVRFKCGQRWNETLRMGSSGTVAQPITLNAYPDGCTVAPAIDGAESLPAFQWQRHTGNIYKVKFPLNQIRNGNLSERASNWRFFAPLGDSAASFDDTCQGQGFACITFNTGSTAADSLLISPTFASTAGTAYQLTARVKVPAGQPYFVYLRKNSAPWSIPGLEPVKRVGTGEWEDVSIGFTAGATADNARIDIGVPGIRTTVLLRELRLTTGNASGPITQVFEGGDPMVIAHHPNAGFDAAKPDSVYLTTASSSAVTTDPVTQRKGSSYFVTAADQKLPAGATVSAGTRVFIRTQNWALGEYMVTGVTGNRVSISPNSAHPLSYPGWGYFYVGALWMLDSPGEWFYDEVERTLYAWTSTGTAPGSNLTVSRLAQAADLYGRTNISVQGIAFRNAVNGIEASRSNGIRLDKIDVRNMMNYGVSAAASVDTSITGSTFRNLLTDAVQAPNSTGLSMSGSDIENTGVVVKADGRVASLPTPSYGAISSGAKSVIRDNRIRNISYIGIAVGDDSVVSSNAIESYCLVLNDCGGLYTFGTSRVTFENNYVLEGRGTRYGIPAALTTHTNALYFDRGSNAGTARGNTLIGSDSGMQLHDAYNNVIENNTFFGNKGQQIWLQQSDRDFNSAVGNVFGNVVRNNLFFPTITAPSVFQNGRTADPAAFATFNGNRYSTLLSSLIASEASPFGSRMFQLSDWRAAIGSSGARALETIGSVGAPVAGRALGLMGSNVVVNGAMASDSIGWTRGGSTPPSVGFGKCADGLGNCVTLTAASSDGMLSSPRFAVIADAWYRVSFDASVGLDGQALKVLVRRSGPTSYESVMGDQLAFNGTTGMKRYSFVFKATGSADVSATSSGARVDFFGPTLGQSMTVANLEVLPISNIVGGSQQFAVLSNTSRVAQLKNCPSTDATACASYISFATGLPVRWPVALSPLQSMIVFAQNAQLPDTDGDGIADTQDRCPGTAAVTFTNGLGCARGQ